MFEADTVVRHGCTVVECTHIESQGTNVSSSTAGVVKLACEDKKLLAECLIPSSVWGRRSCGGIGIRAISNGHGHSLGKNGAAKTDCKNQKQRENKRSFHKVSPVWLRCLSLL